MARKFYTWESWFLNFTNNNGEKKLETENKEQKKAITEVEQDIKQREVSQTFK